MTIFQIRHRITYRYDQPVIIEPLMIRLRPRSDGAQRLHHWHCRLTPQPLSATEILDALGNAALQVSFTGVHREFTVEVESKVETLRTNPFDFLALDARTVNLPVQYEPRVAQALTAYRHRPTFDPLIGLWAAQVAESVQQQTQPFLLRLTEQIQRDYVSETRHHGAPCTPTETFQSKRGACRDLAVLYMDACRSQGIAARFVSGYVHEANRIGESELHAWAEVYLPGGGWRGYDPSLGVAVADAHIPVAASPDPQWAAPTEGCYIGTGTDSTIEYQVNVTAEQA